MRTTERGMTLVELLVAMVVGALVIGAALSLFEHNHRLYHEQDEIVIMQQEMRAILSQMATQIRMAGFDPTRAGGFGFAHRSGIGDPDHGRVTNATAIYFTMDANRDGVLQENGTGSNDEHGGYRLNVQDDGSTKPAPDGVLRCFETGAVTWQPAATNIQSLDFTYFDAQGNATADLSAIRGVRITVVAAASGKRAHLNIDTRTMTTRVQCRNLGL